MKRDFPLSEATKQLIKERQEARDKFEWDKTKEYTKRIRKSIRKDKTDTLIANLEECLWKDIKRMKNGFLPTHTKLKHLLLCTVCM